MKPSQSTREPERKDFLVARVHPWLCIVLTPVFYQMGSTGLQQKENEKNLVGRHWLTPDMSS